MKFKVLVFSSIMLACAFLLWTSLSAQACGPDDDNPLNTLSESRCKVFPSQRGSVSAPVLPVAGTTPAATPTPEVVAAATSLPGTNPLSAIVSTANSSQALDCILPDGNSSTNALGISTQCVVTPRVTKVAVVPPPPAPTKEPPKVAVVQPQPKGDSPGAAITIGSDVWQTVQPNDSVWYKIDNGNSFYLDLWLDTHGASGINFAVYAPNQQNDLSIRTPPKGRGAPNKSDLTHDLYWAGAQATGMWHAVVINSTPNPIQYRIGFKQGTEERNCRTYGEWINSTWVDAWTACR